MAIFVGIAVQGLQPAITMTRGLGRVANSASHKALSAIVRHGMQVARKLAPKRTGALRRSIKTRKVKTRLGSFIQLVVEKDYAAAVEFGRLTRLGLRVARPFLRPAYRAMVALYDDQEQYEKEVMRSIEYQWQRRLRDD